MVDWNPVLSSPDGEVNPYRDRMVARERDLIRNDGWASAAVTRAIDNVVGANFRPIAKPDYRALAAISGNKGFDHQWAEEWSQAFAGYYRAWADDTSKYCDSERFQTLPQQYRLAFRHLLSDGDALAMIRWMPERIRVGGARYATAVQIIDPDRLSNPQLRFDQQTMRGGVEVDDDGAAVAYHIRKAHQGDYFSAARSMTWERIPRETEWGRPVIVHCFDRERAGQHRGVGFLTPVVNRLKMLIKYDGTELDAAIINAFFAAYIESPFDHELVEGALSADDSKLSAYQTERANYHKDRRTALGDVGMSLLFPGEKIGSVSANRPSANYDGFSSAMLRHVAAGTGLVAQQISQNWSEINYSAFRAAMLEAWKTFHRRRYDFAVNFGARGRCVLGRVYGSGRLPMPSGPVPHFLEARSEYCRARWMGPGKGYVDPVKEKQGAILGLQSGLSTLDIEGSEQGEDWREVADQRAVEQAYYRERDLPMPVWSVEQPKEPPASSPNAGDEDKERA